MQKIYNLGLDVQKSISLEKSFLVAKKLIDLPPQTFELKVIEICANNSVAIPSEFLNYELKKERELLFLAGLIGEEYHHAI